MFRRGQIWAYRPGRPRPGPAQRPGVQSAAGDPGGLLSVHLDGHGWLALLSIEPVLRSRLDEHVGTATAQEMEAVDVALAAMLDMR